MPRTVEDDELITVAEVAAVLRVTEQTVWNKLDRGELPCVRLGQRRLRVWRFGLRPLVRRAGRAAPIPSNRERRRDGTLALNSCVET